MFIELTTLNGGKVLINTDNVTAVCTNYKGNIEVWSVGDTDEFRGMEVQESYEKVKFLINKTKF